MPFGPASPVDWEWRPGETAVGNNRIAWELDEESPERAAQERPSHWDGRMPQLTTPLGALG